jgi:hypothetical protein
MKKSIFLLSVVIISSVTLGQNKQKAVTFNRYSGYANITEINSGYGLGSTTSPFSKYIVGLTTSHGYRLNIYGLHVNNSLFGGIGTGALFYNEGFLLPLYGDIRFIMNKRKVSPYLFAKSGLLINPDDFSGTTRLFIDCGGGVQFKINKQISINAGPGLFIQMGNEVHRDAFTTMKIGIGYKPR